MDWASCKDFWPNATDSSFVETEHQIWHVQSAGNGPTVLLIHGAGGSTHSMAGLYSSLSASFHCVSIDLPGQGFTQITTDRGVSLLEMSEDIARFLQKQSLNPDVIIAHSAGAAIALRMALDNADLQDTEIVSINGALGNFRGLAGILFPAIAKVLAFNTLTPVMFSQLGRSKDRVRRILRSTGSTVTDESLACYHALMSNPAHVGNTLKMMASWTLDGLLLELPKVQNRVLFVTGVNDSAVPPDTSSRIARRMQRATVRSLNGLGHLAHEEAPEEVCDTIRNFLRPDVSKH